MRLPRRPAVLASLCALALASGVTACGSGDPVERVQGAPSGPNAPTVDTDPVVPTGASPVPETTATDPSGEPDPPADEPDPPATTTVPGSAATGGAQADGEDGGSGSGTGGASAQDSGTASFTVSDTGELGPAGVQAPASVPVTLTLRNDDDVAHTVEVLIENRPTRELAPGATASVELLPLAPGSYTMLLDGGGSAATLQVGASEGP